MLGGYTTFSTLQLDAVGLGGRKDCVPAASYHLLSVFVRLLAAVLGATLARALGLGGLYSGQYSLLAFAFVGGALGTMTRLC